MPTKKYYGPKAEQYRAESSAYYVAHRKERLAYAKRYCKANKKKLKVKRTAYYKKNRKTILAKGRKYREEHLEERRDDARKYARAHPKRARNYQLWYRYGLTQTDYLALRKKQGGKCAICGKKQWKLVVDHSHKTGKIRGLLCGRCNHLLGFAGDSVPTMKRAIRYLEKSK